MEPDEADVEPGISVTMDAGRVVISPCGHLDAATIEALRELLAGARAAGAVAVVDLHAVDRRDRADALTLLGASLGTVVRQAS